MAPTVRLLDETLIDQIAAGEVIERPANLVKELLENAVDAGASEITVWIEDGGRAQVRVRDDGSGMSEQDVRLAVQRHATSKISTFEDLMRVATLGFRGEALASIGAVSKMSIITRTADRAEGTRLILEGGTLCQVEPVGCPVGTSVEVTDLFYNVPARRKFLRARQTETSKILEVCQRIALSHCALRLSVTSDGRVIRRYLPAENLAERAREVFGQLPLQDVWVERDGLALEASLAPAELARPGARHLCILVNGRPIVDRGLARAIAFAYGEQLPRGHYPRGVVSLRLPSEAVDVNAHPQKTEVRFHKASELMDRVTRLLSGRLSGSRAGHSYWEAALGSLGPAREPSAPVGPSWVRVAENPVRYDPREANEVVFVAQVGDRALICENGREVFVLDRGAAESLTKLEELRAAAESGPLPRQTLLFPERVELGEREARALAQHAESMGFVGFDWSRLGEDAFVIRAVPRPVAHASPGALLRAALEAVETGGAEQRDAALRALAVVAATPNGKPLDSNAARRLAASIRPDHEAHRSCIVGRVALPVAPGPHDD